MSALLAALLLQASEPPRVQTGGAEARTLTIYRDGLAFVTETHAAVLPAGRSVVVFEGVNDQMVPQTAVLTAFEGVSLERNFDQALLSKASLFEALVGETAVLRRTNPGTGRTQTIPAEVVAAERGVVLRTPEGVETLDCTGLPQTLAAPERPAGLLAAPELSVVVEAAEAGRREMTLAYLADGIGWSADYVLTVEEGQGDGAGEAALRGWLTFTNETADAFEDVPTAIVAGTLRVTAGTEAPEPEVPYYYAACWPQGTTSDVALRRAVNPYLLGFPDRTLRRRGGPAVYEEAEMAFAAAPMADEVVVTGARVASEERFGDYRLYRPPGPVTLTPYRTKQVAFLDEAGVEVSRRYEVRVGWALEGEEAVLPAEATYILDNARGGALGRALPAGTVRVMTEANGEAFYLGQDTIRDRAVGLPVEVATGDASAVSARLLWGEGQAGRRGAYRRALTVELTNALDAPAPVRVVLPDWADAVDGFEAAGERPLRVAGEPYPTWDLTVPPNAARRLRLSLRYAD